MMKWMFKGMAALFSFMMLCILALLLLYFDGTTFFAKRTFPFAQWTMLLTGGIALGGICALSPKDRQTKRAKWVAVIRMLPWLALLCVQLVACFHAYFITGWDVRGIVETAYALAGGERDMHAAYLSMYPNNIPIVMLFAAVIRAVRLLLGNPGLDRCVFVLIAGQCLLNTATGMLAHRLLRRTTGSSSLAWCASLIYAAFVGLSPWLMIPYSDSMALLFPTLTALMYQEYGEKKWSWPLLGGLGALGYMIKPQALIVLIAIVIVEGVRKLQAGKLATWAMRAAACALTAALLMGPGIQMIIRNSGIPIKPERKIGMLHFAMMGLNRETNGVYSYDDVVLSANTPIEERSAVQMREIVRRLDSMSFTDMLEHLKKKVLTNYADGTFAWGCEGEFYSEWIEDKDSILSPFLKSLINTQKSNYLYLQTVLHSIWLALLLGCALSGIRCFMRGGEPALYVMMLSIVGLTLFELIFEARARYLYLYAPFYVMLGIIGIWHGLDSLKKLYTWRRN